MPSGQFFANGAWLCCAVLAHNLLRWSVTLGRRSLIDELIVARTVRTRLIAIPGRIVNRAGTPTLRGPLHWPWAGWFRATESLEARDAFTLGHLEQPSRRRR